MRTIRCYIETTPNTGDTLRLRESEARHIGKVLRLGNGAPVTIIDGHGGEWSGAVSSVGKNDVDVAVGDSLRCDPAPPALILAMAPVKSATFEDSLQRAVELGMTAFLPLETDRGIVEFDERRFEKKADKWREHGIAALKQCERLWLPDYLAPLDVSAAIADCRTRGAEVVVLAERPHGAAADPSILNTGAAALFIGPEGGWSEPEWELFAKVGARFLTLGRGAILRTETAALAGLALAGR